VGECSRVSFTVRTLKPRQIAIYAESPMQLYGILEYGRAEVEGQSLYGPHFRLSGLTSNRH
jgi:hypothetical protein